MGAEGQVQCAREGQANLLLSQPPPNLKHWKGVAMPGMPEAKESTVYAGQQAKSSARSGRVPFPPAIPLPPPLEAEA